MINIEKLKLLIIEKLKPLNPDKVILFGSYAYGTPNENSDIDLYIVTKDEFLPDTWKEKNNIYLEYSRKLRDLQKDIPIDLIVHTKNMYNKFIQLNSDFYKNSILTGVRIC